MQRVLKEEQRHCIRLDDAVIQVLLYVPIRASLPQRYELILPLLVELNSCFFCGRLPDDVLLLSQRVLFVLLSFQSGKSSRFHSFNFLCFFCCGFFLNSLLLCLLCFFFQSLFFRGFSCRSYSLACPAQIPLRNLHLARLVSRSYGLSYLFCRLWYRQHPMACCLFVQ